MNRHSFSLFVWLVVLSLAVNAAQATEAWSWNEIVRVAEVYRPTLVAVRSQMAAAEAELGVAESIRYPQLSAAASAERRGTDNNDQRATDTAFGASLGVDQDLYSGGRNAASVRSAQAGFERAKASATLTRAQVTYDLRLAYINLLHAGEEVRLLDGIVARRADNLELVDLRYDGGREHKGSLASSEVQLLEAETQRKQAHRKVALNRDLLAREMGLPGLPEGTTISGHLQVTNAPAAEDLDMLAHQHPSYIASDATRLAAEAQWDGARAGYRPTIGLSASVRRSGDDHAFDEDSWLAGLQIRFPFWPGGRTTHEVRRAGAQLNEADALLEETVNTLVRSLAVAHLSLIDAAENVEVQARYVEANELRAEIARQQYEDGLLSFENWSVIEDDLINRKKQWLASLRSAMVAEAAWWVATGYDAFAGRPPEAEKGKP